MPPQNKTLAWSIKFTLIMALLVLLTFAAYSEALKHGLLAWDTELFVTLNPHIKSLSLDNLYWMLTEIHRDHWHPLTWFSHALDYALFGLEPWGHHLSSILLHCMNTVWLFVLVIVLLALTKTSAGKFQMDTRALAAAGIAALLFGIHPQHVESVAWVAERKDVLSLFFIMPTLLAYLRYASAPSPKNRIRWYLLALFCFFLAILAKSMAVTIPAILILMDIYPLKRIVPGANHFFANAKVILEKIPFFLLSLVSIILTVAGQHESGTVHTELLSFDLRLLNAFNNTIFYLSKLIFPSHLAPFYPLPSIGDAELHIKNLISVAAFCFITFLCGYGWYKKQYYWLAAWLFYLITLSPVIGIIQVGVQAAADRYSYLPTIPFYILAGIGISNIYFKKLAIPAKWGTALLLAAVFFTLFTLTGQQTLIWRNNLTLWHYGVLSEPDSPTAHANLGIAYTRLGLHEKALQYYRHSLMLSTDGETLYRVATGYINVGKLEKALNTYNYMIKHNLTIKAMDNVYGNIGRLYFELGFPVEAKTAAEKALEINPKHPQANSLLSDLASAANGSRNDR